MTETLTPLDIAIILEASSSRDLPRNESTKLYIADGTEPATVLTRAMYEAGLKVLGLRDHVEIRRR